MDVRNLGNAKTCGGTYIFLQRRQAWQNKNTDGFVLVARDFFFS
jgi:hypothetical protein